MSQSLQFGKYIDIYGIKHQIGRFEYLGHKINAPNHLVKNQLAIGKQTFGQVTE